MPSLQPLSVWHSPREFLDVKSNINSQNHVGCECMSSWTNWIPRLRYLLCLPRLSVPADNPQLVEDSSRNPEVDTFSYIHLIIETLSKMSRLDIAIDRIEQRLPVELFKVVEKSNIEIAQKYPHASRGHFGSRSQGAKPTDGRETRDQVVLEALLSVLYARLEAVAHGHRVVHEVVAGIAKREALGNADRLVGGFKGLWKLYQSEVIVKKRCNSISY